MGSQMSQANQEKTYLKVANLNFSGQQSSPFQYFSMEHLLEEEELNAIFKDIIQAAKQSKEAQYLFEDKTIKKLSRIDKVLKSDRYSPLYNKNCGILNGKFVNIQQFKIEWINTLKQTLGWRKLKKLNVTSQDEPKTHTSFEECQKQYQVAFNQLRAFDYLIYVSILRYVYEHTEIESIIRDRACNKYRGFMDEFFSKTYLSINKKIIQTIDFVINNKIDVLFVQEATEKLCNEFEKRVSDYRFIMSKQLPNDPGISVVFFKESSFSKSSIGRKGNLKLLQIAEDKKIPQQVKSKFLSWGKCSFISIDNFILISFSASSFGREMENDLRIIHEKFPGKYVIVGSTLSSGCFRQYKQSDQYDSFPTKMSTCYKKRTYMQFQKQKSGSLIISQTNFILFDKRLKFKTTQKKFENSQDEIYEGVFTIKKQQIQIPLTNVEKKDGGASKKKPDKTKNNSNTINSANSNLKVQSNTLKTQTSEKNAENINNIQIDLLPSQEHPFDQLIVLMTLKIPKKKVEDKGSKKLTKQEKERMQFQTSSSEEEEKAQDKLQMIENTFENNQDMQQQRNRKK